MDIRTESPLRKFVAAYIVLSVGLKVVLFPYSPNRCLTNPLSSSHTASLRGVTLEGFV